MKTHLMRISPLELCWFLGIAGLIVSVPVVLFAFMATGPGRTMSLNGFISLTFTGSLEPMVLVLAFPLLNAIGGFISTGRDGCAVSSVI
jgi:hypothetical protein